MSGVSGGGRRGDPGHGGRGGSGRGGGRLLRRGRLLLGLRLCRRGLRILGGKRRGKEEAGKAGGKSEQTRHERTPIPDLSLL